MYYYQRLKDIREDKDLKQTDIAKIIDTTRQQYQLYESGKREIPFHSVIDIAKYFEVSIDYIAGRTNEKKGLTKSEMSEEETELIKKYRYLNEKRQGILLGTLDRLAGEQSEDEKDKDAI